MLKKLSLDKTKIYEKTFALEQIAKMLYHFVAGTPGVQEIGAEQGDIPIWDDFVIKNHDLSTTYVQIKRQTTDFCKDKENEGVIRTTYVKGKSPGQLRELNTLDKTMEALAKATMNNSHEKDKFWFCFPGEKIYIKKELTIQELRRFKENIKDTTQGEDLKKMADADASAKNIYLWLTTWCGFRDWNHIVSAFKRLEINMIEYETDIERRAKDLLERMFVFTDIDTVKALIFNFLDENSTYAGSFRPREMLKVLQDYLLPQIDRWTLFQADRLSWSIAGINDLEDIERAHAVAKAFWTEHRYRNDLKIFGKYSKNCKITKSLMHIALHQKYMISSQCGNAEEWEQHIKNAVGGTLGTGEDDCGDIHVHKDKNEYSYLEYRRLDTLCKKEDYSKLLEDELYLITLEDVAEKIDKKIENLNACELRDKLELCWNDWFEKLKDSPEQLQELFSSILHPQAEGNSVSGELRVGCKTTGLISEAMFLLMVVVVVLSKSNIYDWAILDNDLCVKVIGLMYWSGSADSEKDIVEIDDYRNINQLLAGENEEILILSGTKTAASDLLSTDLTENSAHNGLLTDRKQPQIVISNERKWKRLIQEGKMDEIRDHLKAQIKKYNLVKSNSIEHVIGGEK